MLLTPRSWDYQTKFTSYAAVPALSSLLVCPDTYLCVAPVGFTPIKDPQDGYTFLSPFGWQEVAVKGQDVVYKDVIEPLESVSVSITPTEKATIEEYGSPAEVSLA